MSRRTGLTAALGVGTGFFSGLLGVGGGFILVPGMVYLLRTGQHEAHGTSLLVIIPVALVGAGILGHNHDVDPGMALVLALGSVGGAVVGARLTRRVSAAWLRRSFGIVAIVVGLVLLGDVIAEAINHPLLSHAGAAGPGRWLIAVAVGLVSGVLSGLLGIGGGAVMVPAMVLFMGLSQHLAQGTSLAVIIPTALSGAITHYRMGNIKPRTAGVLSATGVLGAAAGALLAVAAPDQALRAVFGLYQALTGLRMLRGPKPQPEVPTMVAR